MLLNHKEQFKREYLEKFGKLHGKKAAEGTPADQYLALASLVRDALTDHWVQTNELYRAKIPKQVYYLTLEILPGKFLASHLIYLGIRDLAAEALGELGIDLAQLEAQEPDAGLGNGGLGRLAACFLDSLSSLGIPARGCCLRYKYGLFKQRIVDGYQVEVPDNWLAGGNPWEIRRPDRAVEVRFGGQVRTAVIYDRLTFIHEDYQSVWAVPYDMPIPGYRNKIVNTLRLWSAEAVNKDFDLPIFNRGDYLKAFYYKHEVESISQILYPDDSKEQGRLLRLKQQYFLVSASLQNIISHYKRRNAPIEKLPEYCAIHINDTHPSLAIPELLRILIDEEGMGWDQAWAITTQVFCYTNHTILPEALERWPVAMLETLLPRIYLIVQEINERFRREIWQRYPGDWQRLDNMSVMDGHDVRMANLAVVGSQFVNGVAALHSDILKQQVFKEFYEYFPAKFNNKTNGISHRRFLLKANPRLARLINEVIGPAWIEQPERLLDLLGYRDDAAFLDRLAAVKKDNKLALAKAVQAQFGWVIDPESIYDVQIKRIHAYKRQLLNVLHIMDLYNRLKEDPNLEMIPRTFIFAGKAAPGYYLAKRFIKLITSLAAIINKDERIRGRIRVLFLENYNVSLAEAIIPAADVSEQISTAGKEASGTGNMKMMMNGAITLGTLDGANIEIKTAVGTENMILFGLTADQVLQYYCNGGYSSREEYYKDPRIKKAVDQLINGFFPEAGDEFQSLYNTLLTDNDEFFVLKDFGSYCTAQTKAEQLYHDQTAWTRMAAVNIAHSGKFSSDRTVAQYAAELWGVRSVF